MGRPRKISTPDPRSTTVRERVAKQAFGYVLVGGDEWAHKKWTQQQQLDAITGWCAEANVELKDIYVDHWRDVVKTGSARIWEASKLIGKRHADSLVVASYERFGDASGANAALSAINEAGGLVASATEPRLVWDDHIFKQLFGLHRYFDAMHIRRRPSPAKMVRRQAVGYVRVSTKQQAQYGYGISRQIRAITAHCDAHALDLVAVYTDAGLSGTLPAWERPGLQGALSALEQGEADTLVAEAWDRLARGASAHDSIVKPIDWYGANVVTLNDAPLRALATSMAVQSGIPLTV